MNTKKKYVLDKIIQFNKEKLGFLGLSFKGGTDDLRNSPISDIIEILLGKGFDIKIYDKNVNLSKLVGANKEYILKKIPYVSKFLIKKYQDLLNHSDVIIVVNKEKEFKKILNKVPENTIIFDLVNIDFERKKWIKNYMGISW